jgi:hypothetical protein
MRSLAERFVIALGLAIAGKRESGSHQAAQSTKDPA